MTSVYLLDNEPTTEEFYFENYLKPEYNMRLYSYSDD